MHSDLTLARWKIVGMAATLCCGASPPSFRVTGENLLRNAGRIPKDLFYLAEVPSGAMFCDQAQKARQTAEFDDRFEARFNRLVPVVIAQSGLGWQKGEGIFTPCWKPTDDAAAKSLEEFGERLRSFEIRYGLTTPQ